MHLGSGKFNCINVETGHSVGFYRPEVSRRRSNVSVRFFDCDYADDAQAIILAYKAQTKTGGVAHKYAFSSFYVSNGNTNLLDCLKLH